MSTEKGEKTEGKNLFSVRIFFRRRGWGGGRERERERIKERGGRECSHSRYRSITSWGGGKSIPSPLSFSLSLSLCFRVRVKHTTRKGFKKERNRNKEKERGKNTLEKDSTRNPDSVLSQYWIGTDSFSSFSPLSLSLSLSLSLLSLSFLPLFPLKFACDFLSHFLVLTAHTLSHFLPRFESAFLVNGRNEREKSTEKEREWKKKNWKGRGKRASLLPSHSHFVLLTSLFGLLFCFSFFSFSSQETNQQPNTGETQRLYRHYFSFSILWHLCRHYFSVSILIFSLSLSLHNIFSHISSKYIQKYSSISIVSIVKYFISF